jgi:hypothetical protein
MQLLKDIKPDIVSVEYGGKDIKKWYPILRSVPDENRSDFFYHLCSLPGSEIEGSSNYCIKTHTPIFLFDHFYSLRIRILNYIKQKKLKDSKTDGFMRTLYNVDVANHWMFHIMDKTLDMFRLRLNCVTLRNLAHNQRTLVFIGGNFNISIMYQWMKKQDHVKMQIVLTDRSKK